MAVLAWDEAYSVGNAFLDSDHKILINLVNQLHDAVETGQSRDVMGSILNVLAEYAEHHFYREEKLMLEIGYPERDAHMERHRQFERQVRDMRDRWLAGDHQAVDEDVMFFLKNRLRDHILRADIAYRPWIDATTDTQGGATNGGSDCNV